MRGGAEIAATFVIGPFGQIEEIDDAACALVGYSRAELLALHGSELIVAEERPKVAVSMDRMRQGLIESGEGRLLRKDRSVVAVNFTARRLPQGRLAMIIRERQA